MALTNFSSDFNAPLRDTTIVQSGYLALNKPFYMVSEDYSDQSLVCLRASVVGLRLWVGNDAYRTFAELFEDRSDVDADTFHMVLMVSEDSDCHLGYRASEADPANWEAIKRALTPLGKSLTLSENAKAEMLQSYRAEQKRRMARMCMELWSDGQPHTRDELLKHIEANESEYLGDSTQTLRVSINWMWNEFCKRKWLTNPL